jgi:hypothetical protein
MEDKTDRRQEGQSIIIVALMLLLLFLFAVIAVDLAYGYVHRRSDQNAADAAALAGARELAGVLNENGGDLSGLWIPETDIQAAMNKFAEENGVQDTGGSPGDAVNTNVSGYYLASDGSRLSDSSGFIEIGELGIVPQDARGVEAIAHSVAPSFFGGIVGLDGLPIQAEAAVVFQDGVCVASCIAPIAVITREFQLDQCYNIWNGADQSSSFGWLNWAWNKSPACQQGGSTCNAGCIADNLNPLTCDSGRIELPTWIAGTTGDNNSNGIRSQLSWYIDNDVPFTVPIYDYTGYQGGSTAACGNGDPDNPWGLGFHVIAFAKFQPEYFSLAQGLGNDHPNGYDDSDCEDWSLGPHGGNRITGRFMGFVEGETGSCDPPDTGLIAPCVVK